MNLRNNTMVLSRKHPLVRGLFFLVVWIGLAVSSEAAAQSESASVKKPPPGYEKFEPAPESEQVSAANLVVLAYGAVFVGMFGYLVFVARGQSTMSREVAELASRIERVSRS